MIYIHSNHILVTVNYDLLRKAKFEVLVVVLFISFILALLRYKIFLIAKIVQGLVLEPNLSNLEENELCITRILSDSCYEPFYLFKNNLFFNKLIE